jgi:hypothetical protein
MRMRNFGLLAAAGLGLLLVAQGARALDAPHDQTFSDAQCSNCHALYSTTPAGDKDYSYGCITCHNAPANVARTSLGFPWQPNVHQAVAGVAGNQHSWTGYAQNKRWGAQSPPVADINAQLLRGRLQCAVCHDVHSSSPSYSPGSKHTSIPLGTPVTSGTSTMTLVAVGDAPRGWRVKLQAGNTFIITHGAGLTTPTWLNYVGGKWIPGTDPGQGKSFSLGADVAVGADASLDPNPVATVRFTAATAGNTFDFYVSYPFLRWTNVNDTFCNMCHAERVMDHVRVSGNDTNYLPDGSRTFSHPVNVSLNANNAGYDRTQAGVLDANGATQTVGDGRTVNDLKFDAGVVRCTTCHAVHNGASNSLTN